jgi:hypothetical protein
MTAPLIESHRIRGLARITLRSEYPCCSGLARIVAVSATPRERYDRTCPQCGTAWTVERRTALEGVRQGVPYRVDILDWEVAK